MRARAILLDGDQVALIERYRDGRHYYVFPGGGVEPGETLEQAVAREVLEELGLIVAVGACVAEPQDSDERSLFFLVTSVSGRFGSGLGDEMTGGKPPARGTYRPVWLPVADLLALPLSPQAVARVVAAAWGMGWVWG